MIKHLTEESEAETEREEEKQNGEIVLPLNQTLTAWVLRQANLSITASHILITTSEEQELCGNTV